MRNLTQRRMAKRLIWKRGHQRIQSFQQGRLSETPEILKAPSFQAGGDYGKRWSRRFTHRLFLLSRNVENVLPLKSDNAIPLANRVLPAQTLFDLINRLAGSQVDDELMLAASTGTPSVPIWSSSFK